jgi:predicted solute-binding protein
MILPKFLLGDNTDFPDDIFIIHTEYPQVIINLTNDEVEWFEEIQTDNETALTNEVNELIELASRFYDREMERYKDE